MKKALTLLFRLWISMVVAFFTWTLLIFLSVMPRFYCTRVNGFRMSWEDLGLWPKIILAITPTEKVCDLIYWPMVIILFRETKESWQWLRFGWIPIFLLSNLLLLIANMVFMHSVAAIIPEVDTPLNATANVLYVVSMYGWVAYPWIMTLIKLWQGNAGKTQ